MRLGCPHAGPCASAASLVLAVNQGKVDFHALGHSGSGKPRGDAVAVGCVGELLP